MTRSDTLPIVVVLQTAPLLKDVSITPNATGPGGEKSAHGRQQPLGRDQHQRRRTDPVRVQPAAIRQTGNRRRAGLDGHRPLRHQRDTDATDRNAADQKAVVRLLLAERFQLKTRSENRERPAYALRMVRGDGTPGPKLAKSGVDCDALIERQRKGERPAFDPGEGPPCSVSPHKGRLTGNDITMSELAGVLTGFLDRRVVDRTGLAGRFDLDLVASEIPAMGPPGPSYRPPESSPPIHTALPEQLGLRLEPTTAAVEVLVIEAVRHPLKP